MRGVITSAPSPYNAHGVLWEDLYYAARAAESSLVGAMREALETWLAAEAAGDNRRKGKLRDKAKQLTEKALG